MGNSKIFLKQFNGNNFITLKTYNFSIKANINNYLVKELLNGDVIFKMDEENICIFNIKTFMIQSIYKIINYKDFLNGFFQNKNKNIFYVYNSLCSYEINLKNGKMKLSKFRDKIVIDKYVIKKDGGSSFLVILDENNEYIFIKNLFGIIDRFIIINEKEKMFATLHYSLDTYYMYINVFKIYNK